MVQTLTFEEMQQQVGQSAVPPVDVTQQNSGLQVLTFEQMQEQSKPDNRSFLQRNVVDPIVGREEFDFPELTGTFSGLSDDDVSNEILRNLAGSFIIETGTEGKVDIIRKNIPDATFDRDKFGNIFTDIGGKKFYINKPGLSEGDFLDLASEIVKFAGPSKVASNLTRGVSGIGRFGAQFVAGAGTSIASDILAQEVGSLQPVDLGEAVIVGTVGAAAETVAPAVIGGIAKKVLNNKNLTQKEVDALVKSGIDPKQLTKEQIIKFVGTRGQGNLTQRARFAEGEFLPSPITQSRAQLTGNPTDAAFEREVLRGGRGEEAQNILAIGRQEQQRAIAENIENLRIKFGGQAIEGGIDNGATMAAARAQRKLVELQEQMGEGVAAAYDAAKQARAFVPKETPSILARRFERTLKDAEIDFRDISTIKNIFGDLGDLQANLQTPNSKLRVDTLFRLRRRINNNVFKAAKDNRERLAARKMTAEIDNTLNDYLTGGMLSGDEEAVKLAKEAISKSREYKRIFESKDVVQDLTEKVGFGNSATLKVGADDAVNYIFSKGQISKKGLEGNINKLKKVLPPEEFGAIKEAGFLKLLGRGQREGSFNGKKFATSLERALGDSPNAMKSLYSQEELKLMRRFAKVAERATTDPNVVLNPSGTAAAIFSGVRRFFGGAGDFAVGTLQRVVGQPSAKRRAEEAVRGQLPQNIRRGAGVGGAVGAAAEKERQNER